MNEKNELTVKHRDVVITYNEHVNNWNCDLFTKPAASLAEAKHRIDDKLKADSKKEFKPVNGFVSGRCGGPFFVKCKVTSVADDKQSGWLVRHGDGNREKWRIYGDESGVIEDTPDNRRKVELVNEIYAKAEKLIKEGDVIRKTIKQWKSE